MTKKILLLLPALLVLNLNAGSGIGADNAPEQALPGKLSPAGKREKALALFISAMLEKDADRQCTQLLDVVAADVENCETPLAAFRTVFGRAKQKQKLLKAFNALWAKNPRNPELVCHGAALNRAAGTPARERYEMLKPALSTTRHDLGLLGWENRHFQVLLPQSADVLLELGDHAGLLALFEGWSGLQRAALLSGPCYTAAARCYAAGNEELGKKLEKCFETGLGELKKLEKTVDSEKELTQILVFYSTYRAILGRAELDLAADFHRRFPGKAAHILLMSAALEIGDIAAFDRATAEIVKRVPRFDATELRFKMLLNGKHFKEAEAEIKRVPQKYHYEFRKLLLMKKKDWKGLVGLVSSYLARGGAPDAVSGLALLTAAEKLADHELYRRAGKMLKDKMKIPAIANAVGYVGSTMGLDLDEGRKLLEYALSREPRSAAYLDSIAWIAFKQNRVAEAERFIAEALKHGNPRDGISVILEHAGDIAAASKKDPRRFYELALKYGPFDEEFEPAVVREKLKRLK
ncbi:MAG: hypothetical protein IJT50_17085 [Lentisphaeria bacterium]|nr:hypothetical protein [Lentisphaeria bacterium]